MKLKLDLHPIYDDSRKIEAALESIIEEAASKRATEIEIIPGKGSGALKKTVIRFLERPEIKARYHRIEKDGDNWGRLFVHFRWERIQETKAPPRLRVVAAADCFCCGVPITITLSEETPELSLIDCPSCGSPNKIILRFDRQGRPLATAQSGYAE